MLNITLLIQMSLSLTFNKIKQTKRGNYIYSSKSDCLIYVETHFINLRIINK